jgi:hypothetical protein
MENTLVYENSETKSVEKKEIIENANKIQNNFYYANPKNIFFKKTQKNECAKTIANNMNLTQLIESTFYIIPNKNIIFFDYNIFKLYGNLDNYTQIVAHLFGLIDLCISIYHSYEFHINLHLFSISALERYKKLIEMFAQQADNSIYLQKICIYNSPTFINTILRVLNTILKQDILDKAFFYKKDESALLLKTLFSS